MSDLDVVGISESLWSVRADRAPAGDMNVGVVEDVPATGAPRCGYGGCTQCACYGFAPDYRNDKVCERCGHSFDEHS